MQSEWTHFPLARDGPYPITLTKHIILWATEDIGSVEHLVLRNHSRLIRKFLEVLLSEFRLPSMLFNN